MECVRSQGSATVDGGDGEGGRGRAGGRVDCPTVRMRRWQPLERGRCVSSSRTRSTERDDASSSSSSSRQRTQRTGMRLRNRSRSPWVPRVGRVNEDLQELGLPLGMSFAAVDAQITTVLPGNTYSAASRPSREKLHDLIHTEVLQHR
ncbi:hypothetical protein MUK42_00580 [Musa troglodytarum]|uniref:Uncharacterized protein n=1 Tax=Musa troglodytarum TaxID=320322 RepID=A0A9E7FBI1_9LILI|nr:hypothetical protein MUK42_00580 [Musa troglodytarum]